MAIVKCHECGNGVSTEAKACPKCGAAIRKPLGRIVKWGGSFLGLCLVLAAIFSPSDKGRNAAQIQASAGQAATPSAKGDHEKLLRDNLRARKTIDDYAQSKGITTEQLERQIGVSHNDLVAWVAVFIGNKPNADPTEMIKGFENVQRLAESAQNSVATPNSGPPEKSIDLITGIADPDDAPAASTSQEEELRKATIFYVKVLRRATNVLICNLRSDSWFGSLNSGMQIGLVQEQTRLQQQSDNPNAFSAYAQSLSNWMGKYPGATLRDMNKCALLVNSKQIKTLDEIQKQLTGNYH